MAEFLVGSLAWGALRLTASLVSAGFRQLVGIEEDASLMEWSGNVVFKAREKSQRKEEASASTSQTLEIKVGLAEVRTLVEECHAENTEFFSKFTDGIEATQEGIEVLRNGHLEEAEDLLKLFTASGGDVDYLKDAFSKAGTALVQGNTLDVKIGAALIAVSAGYVYRSKVDSPRAAKDFTVNGTVPNIVSKFAPIWTKPSCAVTPDGKKLVAFLLNLVSCVCVLPPESEVLPCLDKRLLPAFGVLCAAEPELRQLYPSLADVSVIAMLEEKTMKSLIQLAEEADVDVDSCTCKDQLVQNLLASKKSLVVNRVAEATETPPFPLERDRTPAAAEPARVPPVGDASTDRAALMALYSATNGPPVKRQLLGLVEKGGWGNRQGWGTSRPLAEWHGVAVDDLGRVVKLELVANNLRGSIPVELGELTALSWLDLQKNDLNGAIPAEVGGLTTLHTLNLSSNQLSGPIPPTIGGLTSLTVLKLWGNKLSGAVPPELGGLKRLQTLVLSTNQLCGPVPSALGELTALKLLSLRTNQLSGSIPTELGQLTVLQTLALNANQLSGPIPLALGELTALNWLGLHENNLSGSIPTELGGLTALHTLSLYTNQLSGTIPPALAGLTALTWLNTHGNQLIGSKADIQRMLPNCRDVYV